MNQVQQLKKQLRDEVKRLKADYTSVQLNNISKRVINLLSYEPVWAKSEVILLYHSLPDEVNTHDFIKICAHSKDVILPVVVGDILELRRYTGEHDLKKGAFNILEPCGELFTDYELIDFVLVPGVAFDRRGNRLGRGKGYYDKLLPNIGAYKMGICFPFQYYSELIIPTEKTDVAMDKVLTLKSDSAFIGK